MHDPADPVPVLVYVPAPCPKCGARTETEAETMCTPTQEFGGDWSCPAGDRADAEGQLTQPTADSIKALDEWMGRDLNRMEAAEAAVG